MAFQPGHQKVGGRKKGTANKAPARLRKAIFAALDSGEGAQAYFEWLKKEEPAVYGSLLKAFIPKDVNLSGDLNTNLVIRRSYVRKSN